MQEIALRIEYQRRSNEARRKQVDKRTLVSKIYQGYKQMLGKLDMSDRIAHQGTFSAFFRAVHELASEGMSTEAKTFDPVRISAKMMADSKTGEQFKKLAHPKRIEAIEMLRKHVSFKYDFFEKEIVKEDYLFELTPENIDILRSAGAMHVQDVDLLFRTTDWKPAYPSETGMLNESGYWVEDAEVVKSITYKDLNGSEVTLKSPTFRQISYAKSIDPNTVVDSATFKHTRDSQLKALKKTYPATTTIQDTRQAVGDSPLHIVEFKTDQGTKQTVMSEVEIYRHNNYSMFPLKGFKVLGPKEDLSVNQRAKEIGKEIGVLKKRLNEEKNTTKQNRLKADIEYQQARLDAALSTKDQLFGYTMSTTIDSMIRAAWFKKFKGTDGEFHQLINAPAVRAIRRKQIAIRKLDKKIVETKQQVEIFEGLKENARAKSLKAYLSTLYDMKKDEKKALDYLLSELKGTLAYSSFKDNTVLGADYFKRAKKAYGLKHLAKSVKGDKTAGREWSDLDYFELYHELGEDPTRFRIRARQLMRQQALDVIELALSKRMKDGPVGHEAVRQIILDSMPENLREAYLEMKRGERQTVDEGIATPPLSMAFLNAKRLNKVTKSLTPLKDKLSHKDQMTLEAIDQMEYSYVKDVLEIEKNAEKEFEKILKQVLSLRG
jgi:hypothetical protein